MPRIDSAAIAKTTLAIAKVRSLPMRRATHAPRGRREERGGDEGDEQQLHGVLGVQHPRRDVLRAREHEPGRERLQHERRQQRAERQAAPQSPDAVGIVLADARRPGRRPVARRGDVAATVERRAAHVAGRFATVVATSIPTAITTPATMPMIR